MSDEIGDASRVSGLIGFFYEAAMDGGLWRSAADRIAETLGSSSAVLKLHKPGDEVQLLQCTSNLVVSAREQEWADEWHRNDLWVARSIGAGLARIVTDEDLVTRAEQERSGFYQEWLPRLGIHHMIGAVFSAADGATGVLGVHRPRGSGAYGALERRQAALVLPHLQRALRLGQRLAVLSRTEAATLAALDLLAAGVVLLDETGRLVHANQAGEALLRDNSELALVHGRLALRRPALHDRFLALLRAAASVARGGLTRARAAMSVPRARRMPLSLEIAPLRAPALEHAARGATVLVFLSDPEAPIGVTRLRELFGLTRTEAAVAEALARGASPETIAVEMGVGLATVRTHLKRILAKTGAHRQAEAAALLARSVSTRGDH